MALSSSTVNRQITVMEDGLIVLQRVRRVFEDGVVLMENISRILLEPGDDVSTQPLKIQRICNIFWDQAIIDAYKLKKNTITLTVGP